MLLHTVLYKLLGQELTMSLSVFPLVDCLENADPSNFLLVLLLSEGKPVLLRQIGTNGNPKSTVLYYNYAIKQCCTIIIQKYYTIFIQ